MHTYMQLCQGTMGFAVCCHNVLVYVDCKKALSLPVKHLLDACNASVALVHSIHTDMVPASLITLQGLLKHKRPTALALMPDALHMHTMRCAIISHHGMHVMQKAKPECQHHRHQD